MSQVRPWSAALLVLGLSSAYICSTAIEPLYTGNQNTYFPHGLARAGYLLLEHDFFAQTTDPYPLFSALVAFTHRSLDDGFFHLYLAILKAIFLVGLMGVSSHYARTSTTSMESLVAATAFIWSTSALAYQRGQALLGFSPVVVAGSGLANQSTPGWVFQPSSFGALLVLGLSTTCILGLLSPALHGATITERRFSRRGTEELAALTRYVQRRMKAGDQYLIPLTLGDFRLRSGAPTFVDWKSHPLKDVEVLEWRDRIERARRAYRFENQCEEIGHLRVRDAVTHVVVGSEREQPHCPSLSEMYRNREYVLYAVNRTS